MRQKFVISRYGENFQLTIKEYAILDSRLRKVPSSMLRKGDYQFLCKEIYENDTIVKAISQGMNALVSAIRTHNVFPIEPYAIKIAESVRSLFNSAAVDPDPVELFFNDIDLLPVLAD